MKITNEMVVRACDAYLDTQGNVVAPAGMRLALEAAVSDVVLLNETMYASRIAELESLLDDADQTCQDALGHQRAGYEARITELEAKIVRADACEICGDCLLPQPVRCKRHVHTEPGDDEWPEEELCE